MTRRRFQVLRIIPCTLDPWGEWSADACQCGEPKSAVRHYRALLARFDAGEKPASVWEVTRASLVRALAEAEATADKRGLAGDEEHDDG